MPTIKGSINLVKIIDDTTEGYSITSNVDKIYRFISSAEGITYSPENISFIAKNGDNLLPTNTYTSELYLIGYTDFGELWTFFGEVTIQENTSLLDVIQEKKETEIIFKLADIHKYESTNTDTTIKDKFNRLKQILIAEDLYFNYKIQENETTPSFKASKPFSLETGTSDNIAKFMVTLNNIQAAVDASKMIFDVNGLTIKNGGLNILNNNDEPVLGYDQETNELNITGNGTFSGIINATSGSFTGNITANSGIIGGFIIGQDGLFSVQGATKNVDGSYNTTNSAIRLYGENGSIYADNLTLGSNAVIEDSLKLGDNVYIKAVNAQNTHILEFNNSVYITSDGKFGLTDIIIDGANSTISSQNGAFSITSEVATFNNIVASGKISTVVFEKDHVQSAGGAMVFKSAYQIEKIIITNDDDEKSMITLKDEFDFGTDDQEIKAGDYIYLIKKNGEFMNERIKITSIKNGNLFVAEELGSDYTTLINIGQSKSMIIGINSNDGQKQFLYPRGLTMSELIVDETTSTTSINLKTFIGDLSSLGIVNVTGNGLYASNAYLTGSLTTTGSGSYAGINTLNNISSSFITDDISPIMIWAGANSTSESDIQEAKFQVTENGSIYASQGYFKESIITDSEIYGADIYAARIHGYENNQEANLSFYDAKKGITFYSNINYDAWNATQQYEPGDGCMYSNKYYICILSNTNIAPPNDSDHVYWRETTGEIFSIGEDGLKNENNYFIKITKDQNFTNLISFFGDEIHIPEYRTSGTQYLHLKNNKIYGAFMGDKDIENDSSIIKFSDSDLELGTSENNIQIMLTEEKVIFDSDKCEINCTNIGFNNKMKYQNTDNGYNLYIE